MPQPITLDAARFSWSSETQRRFDPKSSTRRTAEYDVSGTARSVKTAEQTFVNSPLHRLFLECYDECLYNDVPQYLIHVREKRLYSRAELWKKFRPIVDKAPVSVEKASTVKETYGEHQLRADFKKIVKQHIKYAIFSHRWGEDEPEFRDISSRVHGERPTPVGRGYEKLRRFCTMAERLGCTYAWSDTCCINKESSSELEEAIRSMYHWYKDAFVCIAYLGESSSVEDFGQEPWFTRGWTLQELLAPKRLRMYGKGWLPLCPKAVEGRDKEDKDFNFPNDKFSDFMVESISKVTSISLKNIRAFNSRSAKSTISMKMGWASKRKTTRVEDIAYSLLGIFDITMSIAYGEGDRAFHRLLESIAQRYGDPTFFAWAGPCSRYSLVLPRSPASYQASVGVPFSDHYYVMNKRGIQLKVLVIPVDIIKTKHHYTLQPKNALLRQNLRINGHFLRTPKVTSDPAISYAVGVVDFQFDRWRRGIGYITPDHPCFGILIRLSAGQADEVLVCRKMDTKNILPMITCRYEHAEPLQNVILEHQTYTYI